jgi:NitT/TauT family transport system permease protein
LAISLAVLLAWEAGVRGGRIVPLLFPAPSSILATTLGALASGSLLGDLGATLMRVVLGVLLGSVAGILVGLAMGWWRPLRAALDPFVAGAYAVPKIAVLPLFLVFFGVGELPKVIIATLSAFFPVLISSMDGVRQIHPEYFQVAENYGANRLRVVTRVLLPGSLPYVLTGVRLGLNATLLLTVAAEMVTGQTGLGAVIWRAWETMRTEQLYASLLIIVTLGVGANVALQALARTVMPWQPEQHR